MALCLLKRVTTGTGASAACPRKDPFFMHLQYRQGDLLFVRQDTRPHLDLPPRSLWASSPSSTQRSFALAWLESTGWGQLVRFACYRSSLWITAHDRRLREVTSIGRFVACTLIA